jgi:hypothetical protein
VALLWYRPWAVLATLAAAVAIGVPWYYVVQTLRHVKPVTVAPASSVYWGSLYFNTHQDLSRWLHHRGARYSVWARRHPHAAARIGR